MTLLKNYILQLIYGEAPQIFITGSSLGQAKNEKRVLPEECPTITSIACRITYIYDRNKKRERQKALGRYHKGKSMGKKRTLPSEIRHCPPINSQGPLVVHVEQPAIHITGKTNLKRAINNIWK
ncbi:hypothetical protein M422DRAFT_45445 [Sphaerobolus stellatus SS14]|nr:hypothetical protein M422DRAFT_45445 [Sphaerobolus stellatus SS14]